MKIGDRVKWSSQAGSYTKEKIGTVVGVVPAGEVVNPVGMRKHFADYHPTCHELMFDGYSKRDHESYLVLVERGKAKAKLYWPLVKYLIGVKDE